MSIDLESSKVCLPGRSTGKHPSIAVVSKTPVSDKRLVELHAYLSEAGFNPTDVFFTSANRCNNWQADPSKSDIKECRHWLFPELARVSPAITIALGNEALLSLTGHSGIMKWRGKELKGPDGSTVIATISPAMVARNPGLRAGLVADLSLARRAADGTDGPTPPPPRILGAYTPRGVRVLTERLRACDGFYFDVETNGFNEWTPDARLLTMAIALWGKDHDRPVEVWGIPLAHPESPWLEDGKWKGVLTELNLAAGGARVRAAHNGKFDVRWGRQFGFHTELTFDTLLAAHLLDENRPKGLEPLASSLLGVPNWKIDNKQLIDVKLSRVIRYNAYDSWYGAYLYFLLREQLKKQPPLARLFMKMLMPSSETFVPIEQRGIWTDRPIMHDRYEISKRTLQGIDEELYSYCPSADEVPANIKGVNFNPSNFARWMLFDYMGYPILGRGKEKEDGSPGDPSMSESIMLKLRARDPSDRFLELMIERTKWQKYSTAFFGAYVEQVDDHDRIHTNFKITGTVTGRLSSGKAEQDKVSGRVQNRGVNLQQVPRDSFVRGIFGAPPGWVFVEADYSQIELRVAAFIARERAMLHMYSMGEDIHMATAMRLTGRPASQITKEERKKAKAVNFGFLYGMGWKKFIETAWTNYGLVVSEAEAQAARKAFFVQFPDLLRWHSRQRTLATKYKRVQSPLGRVRHLPDIDSPNDGVRHEAERQAINSPVQAMASDMTLLALVLLQPYLMIDYEARSVGTVHDAVNFEMPVGEVPKVVPLIRRVMEDLPLETMFKVHLDVPIIADIKIGTRWGSALEVPGDVSGDGILLKRWMRDHAHEMGLR